MLNEFYILFFIKLVDISQRERGFFIISTTMTLVRKSKVPINEKKTKNKQTNKQTQISFLSLHLYCVIVAKGKLKRVAPHFQNTVFHCQKLQ